MSRKTHVIHFKLSRPHRLHTVHTMRPVATYVVRIVVCVYVSVCLRVEHQDVLNRSICRWEEGADSCGSKEPYIRRGSKSPTGKALLRGHAYNVTNASVHRVRRAATFASGGRQTTRNVMMCRHQQHCALFACRHRRMCLPGARGGQMHPLPLGVTRQRCGLLPN